MKKILFAFAALALVSIAPAHAQTSVDSRLVESAGVPIDTVIAGKVGTADNRLPRIDISNRSLSIGINSGPLIGTATQSTLAIGDNALGNNADCDACTAVGVDAGRYAGVGVSYTPGDDEGVPTQNGLPSRASLFLGFRSGHRSQGSSNIAVGPFAMGGCVQVVTPLTANDVTMTGEAAGCFLQGAGATGSVGYGFNSQFKNRSGAYNDSFGTASMLALTSGGSNHAAGTSSYKWGNGTRNSFTGPNAGQGYATYHLTSAAAAAGATTIYFADTSGFTVGDVLYNGAGMIEPATFTVTAVVSDRITISAPTNNPIGAGLGVYNLHTQHTGTGNTGDGSYALQNITAGASNNTAMGSLSCRTSLGVPFTGSNNICIGQSTQVPDPAGSNQLSIGNLIYGTGVTTGMGTGLIGVGRVDPQFKVHVAGTFGADALSATAAGDDTVCYSGTTGELRHGSSCGAGLFYAPAIEAAASNRLAQVRAIGASPWTMTNASVGAASTPLGRFGATDAQTITSSATGGYADQIAPIAADSSTIVTASAFFAPTSAAATYSVRLALCGSVAACNSSPTVGTVNFNTGLGTVTCTTGFDCGTTLFGPWRRIWVNHVNNGSSYVGLRLYANGGSGAASSAIVWGPQIEGQPAGATQAAAVPTSTMQCVSAGCGRGTGVTPYALPNVGDGGPGIVRHGAGSPEGVVTAGVGSLYTRSDGGAGTTLYVKESGAGNTGWIAK